MLNQVNLIGSLGSDPESRFFPSGDRQVTASLATSRRWKDKETGERKEKTTWHRLVFNRGLAKVAAEYLKKGSKIYVSGEIDYQEWEKDGVKKYMTRILVSEMHMLDTKREGSASSTSVSSDNSPPPSAYAGAKDSEKWSDDNLPF